MQGKLVRFISTGGNEGVEIPVESEDNLHHKESGISEFWNQRHIFYTGSTYQRISENVL